MALPEVAQATLLADVFAELLEAYAPHSVAVLGCAGGNGFEHISTKITKRVVAVDLNSAYISACGARFERRLPELELFVGDIERDKFAFAPVDLVYAGLVFEYVDVGAALRHIRPKLVPRGTLATIVQLPSPTTAPITPSPFARVQALARVMRLVPPEELQTLATRRGFEQISSRKIVSRTGKSFQVQTFSAM